uniref:Uncharacterized protein n=1 Tax=Megaselia scalaris TaxID=36166 RepID=T1GL96_MEGSC
MSSMERWNNKVALITGASSGIGATCAIDLVNRGMIVVAVARRKEKLEDLKNKVADDLKSRIIPIKCDVTVESEVVNCFNWVLENIGVVSVLVNSAGIAYAVDLVGKYTTNQLKTMVDVGIIGTALCVRETFKQMKEHSIDGHVILMNSTVGHNVPPFPLCSMNIYPSVKYATTAMAETYRREFSNAGTNIKVTSLCPGEVNSGIWPPELRDLVDITMLHPEDISNAILYCLSTPPNVVISELFIKPLHGII